MIIDSFCRDNGSAIFTAWTTQFPGILYVETRTDLGAKGFELISKSEWEAQKAYYRAF